MLKFLSKAAFCLSGKEPFLNSRDKQIGRTSVLAEHTSKQAAHFPAIPLPEPPVGELTPNTASLLPKPLQFPPLAIEARKELERAKGSLHPAPDDAGLLGRALSIHAGVI